MRRALPLALLLAAPAWAEEEEDPALAALLATPGDVAYGEFLAGECTSCHQPGQANEGVPWITGKPVDLFATSMHDYRTQAREHQIMNMIAARLGDEEIAALAAYFAALE